MESWVDQGELITPQLGVELVTAWSKVWCPNCCATVGLSGTAISALHYLCFPAVLFAVSIIDYETCIVWLVEKWHRCFVCLSDEAQLAYQTALAECHQQEVTESWNLVKNVADLLIAINSLPWRPFLWAGKLQPSRTAALGTVSSLVGLHLLIQAQRKARNIQWHWV